MYNDLIRLILKLSRGSIKEINLLKNSVQEMSDSLVLPGNSWLGIEVLKNPLDLMILQEIMYDKRPDTIIETGTFAGGSAYYMATLMDLLNIDGKVISIDLAEVRPSPFSQKGSVKINGKVITFDSNIYKLPVHPKLEFIRSDCLKAKIPKLKHKVMVTLDCDHSAEHVYQELEKFSKYVTVGQYLIVEDTYVPDKEKGSPIIAINKFLRSNKNFVVDKSREKYGISTSLGGYLLKVS